MITAKHNFTNTSRSLFIKPQSDLEPTLIVMENHDEAYQVWKNAGCKNKTLLHFDAHIDFKWIFAPAESLLQENTFEAIRLNLKQQTAWSFKGIPSDKRVHIGNYIHQALQDGMIKEFVWIHPDDPDFKNQTGAVSRILQNLAADAPHFCHFSQVADSGSFQGEIYGIPFYAVSFSEFQKWAPREDILLNIDLDFFTTHSLYTRDYPFSDFERPSFWLTPEHFIRKLEALQLSSDLCTLAYSVEEGYTPLGLKFLGRELAERLTHSLSEKDAYCYRLLRNLYEQAPGERRAFIPLLEKEAERIPCAEIEFNLALLYIEEQQWDRARQCYEEAVKEDASYRTAYNHPGPILWNRGHYERAGRSYEKMKKLDPKHPDYQLYDLKKLTYEKKWKEGVRQAKQMLLQGLNSFELHLQLAECHFQLREYREAWNVLNIREENDVEELRFSEFLWLKVRTAFKIGADKEALYYLHKLTQFGFQDALIHWLLAGLYFKRTNFYKMKRHLGKALRQALLEFRAFFKKKAQVRR